MNMDWYIKYFRRSKNLIKPADNNIYEVKKTFPIRAFQGCVDVILMEGRVYL